MLDGGTIIDERIIDSGERCYIRRYGMARIYESRKSINDLSATDFNCANFCDASASVRSAATCFEIKDDKSCLVQGSAKFLN